jgi:outer membrane autotransporter protein
VKDPARFSTLLQGGDEFGTRSASDNQAGSTISRPFAVAGVDFQINENAFAGFALGYTDSRDTFNDGAGRTTSRTTSAHAFVSAQLGTSGIVLDGAAGYGWGRIDSTRNLTSLNRAATASPDARVWSAALKASRALTLRNQATLIPYAQVDIHEATADGYTESGAGAANLVIPERTTRNSSFEGGLTLIMPIKASSGAVAARLQAGWHHLMENGADTFSTRLTGSPIAFDTEVDGLGRDSAHVEAALNAMLSHDLLATLGYRGMLGAGGQTTHAIEARFVLKL